jgi:probable HAF family extracellular repeat protein
MRSSLVLWMAGAPALAWFVFVGQMFGQTTIPERRYHVIDLGALGDSDSRAFGINNKGQVVGSSSVQQFFLYRQHAFYYWRGSMLDLIDDPGFMSHYYAQGINVHGDIAGYVEDTGLQKYRSVLYVNGSVQDLGTLGGMNSAAYALNNNRHIVGWAHNTAGAQRAFLYSDGLMRDLGTLGGSRSVAFGINNRGHVVGWAYDSSERSYAFLHSGGLMRNIGVPGSSGSYANSINDLDQVVGASFLGGLSRAFLYSQGAIQDLGTLGGSYSAPYGINLLGEIVGESSRASSASYRAFIYSNGSMKDLNDLLVTANSGWVLEVASAINDLGQIVGTGKNPLGQNRAFLLNPVDVNWIPTVTNTPVTPTYTPLPAKAAGKTNLIVVTHGAIRPLQSVEDATGWIHDMTNSITRYLATNNLTGWQVVAYQWTNEARFSFDPRTSQLGPWYSLNNAKDIGEYLGAQVSTQGWAHIHLMAHSAGSGLIQSIADKVATNANLTVHTTFLDPFFGFGQDGKDIYGRNADWSDHYFSRDIGTGGDILKVTQGIAKHSHNVDTTWLDPEKKFYNVFVSTNGGVATSCTKTTTAHDWPIQFYLNSFLTNSFTNYQGFGFPLSKEGGRWSYALSQYVTNNNPALILGTADDCPDTAATVNTIAHILPLSPLTQFIIESATGSIEKHTNDFVATTGSPVWLAQFVTPTNTVNFVSFDAQFLSVTGSQGVVTVYWDTNIIGTIDGRIVTTERRQYSFPFPRTEGSLSYMFGVRLDPLGATPSSIQVSNVVVGLTGPAQPFQINQTTNSSGGLKVWELTGPSGYEYVAQVSTNLIDWEGIATLRNTNGTVRFVDPSSTNSARRFYRAVVP